MQMVTVALNISKIKKKISSHPETDTTYSLYPKKKRALIRFFYRNAHPFLRYFLHRASDDIGQENEIVV